LLASKILCSTLEPAKGEEREGGRGLRERTKEPSNKSNESNNSNKRNNKNKEIEAQDETSEEAIKQCKEMV
jgi:hypothetical protein